ncbi:MAG TPA: hypothetical protein VGW33_06540 [Terriglobia bacterium]|nr:hypothetical protein [Terriglobia bacterium]
MGDDVVRTGGVLLHDESHWPCAMCRPQAPGKGGSFLCVDCAHKIVMSSFTRFEGKLPCPASVEDTLAFLETQAALGAQGVDSAPTGWDLLNAEAFDLEDR